VAYLITSLMQSVIETGTGIQASELRRPLAGKTGTTSDARDGWFSAFTPDLVATVWVGFDDNSSLGSSVTGGRAALPIWLDVMKSALEKRPRIDFSVPPGVESVRIDPLSGLRAPDGSPGRMEFFLEGTAPEGLAARPGEVKPEMLFLEDPGRARR
jgi:penicillin-binding protein 1A